MHEACLLALEKYEEICFPLFKTLCLKAAQKLNIYRQSEPYTEESEEIDPNWYDSFMQVESNEIFHKALKKLSKMHRAILCYLYRGYTIQEISEKTDIPKSSVHRHIKDAQKMLQKLLEVRK
ncbi:MAG: sigma-70 family RNA polymerase sigma factor [Methanothermobacter tenebrarum]